MAARRDPMRIPVWGLLAFLLLAGWAFVASQNNFHITPPVVFVCLGYLAVVALLFNLWRTGSAVFEPDDGRTWSRPAGARGDLDKEKRTLLKAIKEAEFDQAMGKLSKADAEQLIRMYRARAIEVIKEIDHIDAGQAGTVRQRIEREVKARLEVAEKAKGKGKKEKEKETASGVGRQASDVGPQAEDAKTADDMKTEAKEASS